MRVVYISPYIPDAAVDHAGGRFLYHYITTVARYAEVVLVGPASDRNLSAKSKLPAEIHVELVPLDSGRRKVIDVVRGLRHKVMAAVGPGFRMISSFTKAKSVRSFLQHADIIEVQWSQYLGLVPYLKQVAPYTPVVAFLHDVLYQSYMRRAKRAERWQTRLRARVMAPLVKNSERRLANKCDRVFVFSKKDARLLRMMGVRTKVEIVQPHIMVPPRVSGPSPEPVALFVGAMARPENYESVRWFLTRVWPVVRQSIPEARLVIAGSSPPGDLVSLGGQRGIEVTGYLSNLSRVYESARVFVAPLQTGAGVKFKVLDAMAYGLPVVATPVGAEGIVEEAGPSVFACISDDPTELAVGTIKCLSDLRYASEVGRAGRRWVESSYNFEASVLQVVETYKMLTKERR